jgi:hypothetical protein
LDAVFANAGARGDNDGDVEAVDRSKVGEEVKGLGGGRTEVVRLTGSAWDPVAFLSLAKGGSSTVERTASASSAVSSKLEDDLTTNYVRGDIKVERGCAPTKLPPSGLGFA